MTQGDLYFWKKDQEVPDMWHVLFDYPKKQLAVTFNCSFHNRHTARWRSSWAATAPWRFRRASAATIIAEWKDDNGASRRAPGRPDKPEYDTQPANCKRPATGRT